jgi:hypothetical protein
MDNGNFTSGLQRLRFIEAIWEYYSLQTAAIAAELQRFRTCQGELHEQLLLGIKKAKTVISNCIPAALQTGCRECLLKSVKSFHFDLGDSSMGPIGYCAGIIASTPEDGLPGGLPSFPRK